MSSRRIDYKKVSKAYDLLKVLSVNNRSFDLNKAILNYIKAFPGCSNTELERYLVHKTKDKMTIDQSVVSNRVRLLVKYGYILKRISGITNMLFIGDTYYKVAKALHDNRDALNYNELELLDL